MKYTIVGLGNPGEEYIGTRHNVGRTVLDYFRKKYTFSDWENNKKLKALVSEGGLGSKKDVLLLLPETFMNKSGSSIKPLITSAKRAKQLVVVHDDLDLPLGKIKITFGRGSGGHRGVESVMRALRTKDFLRVRVGIAPTTPTGKMRKPKGEKKVTDFIMGCFKKQEQNKFAKVKKKISDALEMIIEEGSAPAMGEFN